MGPTNRPTDGPTKRDVESRRVISRRLKSLSKQIKILTDQRALLDTKLPPLQKRKKRRNHEKKLGGEKKYSGTRVHNFWPRRILRWIKDKDGSLIHHTLVKRI